MIQYKVIVDNGGCETWTLNGKLHRENGPAMTFPAGSKFWYINGLQHNANGPAGVYPNESKEWYLEGVEYTEEEYKQKMNPDIVTIKGKKYRLEEIK